MCKDIENKIEFEKNNENITIPKHIDNYILNGIKKAKRKRKSKLIKNISVIAASLLMISFIITVRISPSFAELMINVPVLKDVVKLIYKEELVKDDKGLQLAIENEFMQHIGASDEHEDLVFTVEDIIVDEMKMIIFYSIENKGNHELVNLFDIKYYDENGNKIKASGSWSSFINKNMTKEKRLYNKVTLNFYKDTVIPDIITMETKMNKRLDRDNKGTLDSTWKVDIPIDKTMFESQKDIYELNEVIEIKGQKIYFDKMTVYPTTIALDVKYDKNNTKRIFSFDDIKITDEKGEWLTIRNGVTGMPTGDNSETLFFQSNYFKKPNNINIELSSIRALDKDKLEVIVDLENNKILKAPDNRLRYTGIGNDTYDGKYISFELTKDPQDENRTYSIFSHEVYDNNGDKVEYKVEGNSSLPLEEGYKQLSYLFLENISEINGPITLKIHDYPNRIKGYYKIKVK